MCEESPRCKEVMSILLLLKGMGLGFRVSGFRASGNTGLRAYYGNALSRKHPVRHERQGKGISASCRPSFCRLQGLNDSYALP